MVAFGGIGLIVLALAAGTRTQFQLPIGENGELVPIFPNDQFATFILSATIGSFAIELVYLILAVAAFRLVPKAGNKPWQYAIVAVAVITPILGFYGALQPQPHDRSNYNWEAIYWTIGLIVLALRLVRRRCSSPGATRSTTPRRTRPSITASRRSTRRWASSPPARRSSVGASA